MSRGKRRGAPGDIVRIDIGDGRHTYGVLLTDPYMAVYDLPTIDDDEPPGPADVLGRPVLFIVAVYDRAIGLDWPVVGRVPAGSTVPTVPERFTQDLFNLQRCKIIDVDGNMRPATPEECVGLERAAVWEVEHVAERIRDHYAGRTNVALDHMKVKL